MVREVSEDHIYDTIEFNEFLQMMSKQQRFGMTEDSLKEAFRLEYNSSNLCETLFLIAKQYCKQASWPTIYLRKA